MLEKMRPIIAEQLNVQESEIKENTKLKEDLGADSLDLFELVMALEEEFGVEIPSEDLEDVYKRQVVDEQVADGPKNANGTYLGNVTVRTAVEKSINTIAWKLYEELTPQVGLSYLENMHFSRLDAADYVPDVYKRQEELSVAYGGLGML